MNDLPARVARLSPEKRELLARLLDEPPDAPAGDAPADRALVAYLVPTDPAGEPAAADLRRFLGEHLPEPLIPAAFVVLERLPRTPGGKVDLHALPEPPAPAAAETFVAPRTPVEQALARVWAEVLGIEPIGVHDNFFEIGGDSISSIQIIARARQSGLRLEPGQLFRHQSIAELAPHVAAAPAAPARPAAAQQPERGPSPLTPIQRWFLEQPLAERHHWHQLVRLEAPPDLTAQRLETALRLLAAHHDALRLRLVEEPGGWRQLHAGADEPVPVARVDLSGLPAAERDARLAALPAPHRTEPEGGPLFEAVLFERGPGAPPLVQLGAHHLIVDLLSWKILLEDLDAACRRLARGEAVAFPARTSSYRAWGEALEAHARSEEAREELDYWLAATAAGAPRLPRDRDGVFTEASARSLAVTLEAGETRTLLEAPAALGAQPEELLLAALLEALAPWTGRRTLLAGLERHGREPLAGVDVSRTVGWFTAFFPVLLDAPEPADALRRVRERLRRVPRGGIGYGALRYLHPDAEVRHALRRAPEPELIFNYLGRLPAASGEGGLRLLAPPTASRGPLNRRGHLLELNAFAERDRLTVAWTFSENVHRAETIARLAEAHRSALRGLLAPAPQAAPVRYTPADFPDAGLDQAGLDRFLGRL